LRCVLPSESQQNNLKTLNMKTVLNTLIAILILAPAALLAQTNGRIKVTVLDEARKPIPGAVVQIIAGGPMTGGQTDMDGIFTFVNLNPGAYDVQTRVTGYKRYVKQGIQVAAGQTAYAEYQMVPSLDTLGVIEVTASQSPVDPTFSTIQNISATQVKTMAADRGNVVAMVTGTNSQVSEGKGGQLVMRGSREGASTIYIDGEKMYGTAGTPALGIAQVSVLSGGIPAEYGDLSGGAIIITTHSFYTGMAAQERMYQSAAEEAAADSAAALEKSGQRVENNDEVIEKGDTPKVEEQPKAEEQPKGEEQPAPKVEEEQPEGEQPK
jgi:hypothetical protein